MENTLRADLTVRLFTDRECFAPDAAELLRRVQERHSLRAAAMSMDMAYSRAWTILRNAQEGLGIRLLISSTGGKGGGGTVLTPEGEQMLAAYEEYCRRLENYGEELFAECFAFYKAEREE